MSSKIIILLLFIFVVVGAAFGMNFSSKEQQTLPIKPSPTNTPSEKITIIAKNLQVPWALAFLPDGDILFTERSGNVKLLGKGSKEPILLAKIGIKQIGESGLHGIAVHPDFPQKRYVYLYYTYSSNGDNTLNKVSRFDFDPDSIGVDGEKLSNEKVIVDAIPGAILHDGGRIKFGPDGFLYITTGDAQNPSLAQDKKSLAGKILRVSDDGRVEIYSLGHRNPQGIVWDDKGRLFATEHGSTACDELNLIEKGSNYGWPTIRCDQKQNDMVSPVLQSANDTWAPAGLAFYKGSLFFAGLRGQTLYEAIPNEKGVNIKEHFKEEFGRIRDVVLGPDNMLYITTSNKDGRGSPKSDDDKIIRVNPEQL